MQGDDIEIVVATATCGLLEAGLRDAHVGERRIRDEAPRLRDVLGIEIVALEGHVRVGGREQRQPEALSEAELQHPARLERAARRAADGERAECHMARCGFPVEPGRISDVRDVTTRPIHHDSVRCVRSCRP